VSAAKPARQVKPLAAVIYDQGEDVNRIIAEFAEGLARRGFRLGGVVQISADAQDCGCRDAHVLDLETGARIPILQNLGSQSQSCRVDPAALVDVSYLVAQALTRNPDLLFINRFGKLEAEGKGMIAEIGAAATSEVPVLVGVAARYLEQWRLFTAGLDEELACTPKALEDWWAALVKAREPVAGF
jgi:hypothetical protein